MLQLGAGPVEAISATSTAAMAEATDVTLAFAFAVMPPRGAAFKAGMSTTALLKSSYLRAIQWRGAN
jgi:hypothetical protein